MHKLDSVRCDGIIRDMSMKSLITSLAIGLIWEKLKLPQIFSSSTFLGLVIVASVSIVLFKIVLFAFKKITATKSIKLIKYFMLGAMFFGFFLNPFWIAVFYFAFYYVKVPHRNSTVIYRHELFPHNVA